MGERTPRETLGELARLFLRLGVTAFGGPAAHLALMHHEVVVRRGWLAEQRFLDLVAAANLLPGPTSTELALHIGWERGRWAGMLLAGVCFIAPGAVLTAALAWAYVAYGTAPSLAWLLYGVKPVVVAVVLQAIWLLARRAARSWPLRVLGVLAVGAAALGVSELAVLCAGGAAAMAWQAWRARGAGSARDDHPALAPLLLAGGVATASGAASAVTLPGLFAVFLKAGGLLFGSGYVLLAFLRADLVERLGWLTEGQLVDAVAMGQVTPGPVFTTATFIGYVLAGPGGAAVATIGIFLPAFLFVAVSGPLVPRLRASPRAAAFLDGVTVASLALMIVVSAQLAGASLVDAPTVLLALAATVLLVRYRVNATWLIVGGALCGLLISWT